MLPAFPSQDGPGHSYVAWVFAQLLDGPTPLSDDFDIRSLAPPYATLNYLIVLLQGFLSPLRAEQVIVCIYILLLAFGFRHFVRTLFPGRSPASLLIFVFLFGTVVFQGFYNFGLGLGLFFWAAAFWVASARERAVANAVAFLAVLTLLGLTHPVALAFLAGFTAWCLIWRVAAGFREHGLPMSAARAVAGQYRLQLYLLFASLVPCLYVASFIDPDGTSGPYPSMDLSARLSDLAGFAHLAPYSSPKPWALMLFAIMAVLALAGLAAWQRRQWAANPYFWSVVTAGAGAFVVYLVSPTNVGSALIAIRFPLFGILMLVAAAVGAELPRVLVWPFRAGILLLIGPILAGLYVNTVPMAQFRTTLAEAPPVLRPGARAILLATDETAKSMNPPGALYSPCLWGASLYFQQYELILEKPFLDGTPLHSGGIQARPDLPPASPVRTEQVHLGGREPVSTGASSPGRATGDLSVPQR